MRRGFAFSFADLGSNFAKVVTATSNSRALFRIPIIGLSSATAIRAGGTPAFASSLILAI